MDRSFDCHAEPAPASPVVLSVPHAGRDYPLALRAALAVPMAALMPLEDRHVDAVALAARGRETLLIQRLPRAWIDLHRAEHARDARIDEGARAISLPIDSAKVKSGLGLVPRRAIGMTPLWRRRFDAVDIASRIERDHRPYHAALADALAAARAAFGVAILIDIHSMPRPASGAEIVLGDRFGRAAGARFVARAEAAARGAGYATALNLPYAGGHILATHGAPGADIHAIQLEIDRTAYLDAALDRPGPGLPRVAAMLRQMIAALAEEALDSRYPLAAE